MSAGCQVVTTSGPPEVRFNPFERGEDAVLSIPNDPEFGTLEKGYVIT